MILDSTVTTSRRIFFRKWSNEYRGTIPHNAEMFLQFARALLTGIVKPLVQEDHLEHLLVDRKGRESSQVLLSELVPLMPLHQNEVFTLRGEMKTSAGNGNDDEDESSDNSFGLDLHTEFHDFEGAHHIRHRIIERRMGDVIKDVPLGSLGTIANWQPSAMRFGLEYFTSKWASSMLGFSPSVTSGIYIDVSPERLSFEFFDEELVGQTDFPGGGTAGVAAVREIFSSVYHVDLERDYKAKLG